MNETHSLEQVEDNIIGSGFDGQVQGRSASFRLVKVDVGSFGHEQFDVLQTATVNGQVQRWETCAPQIDPYEFN